MWSFLGISLSSEMGLEFQHSTHCAFRVVIISSRCSQVRFLFFLNESFANGMRIATRTLQVPVLRRPRALQVMCMVLARLPYLPTWGQPSMRSHAASNWSICAYVAVKYTSSHHADVILPLILRLTVFTASVASESDLHYQPVPPRTDMLFIHALLFTRSH